MKPNAIKLGGIAVIIGCISVVIADVIGILVYEDHNPIKQTISQLAHGKYAYIQDIGLTLFGVGIIGASLALYLLKSDSKMWIVGAILLGLSGVNTIILAEFNQFAGQPGTMTHIVLAISIGVLFSISSFVLGVRFKEFAMTWYR